MAGLTALFGNLWILEHYTGEPIFDLRMAMNGAISGLVAITAGCGVVEPWAAVATGFVSGFLYLGGSKLLLVLRLDDAVDAIPCHMVNGAWGLISVGLWASPSRLLAAYGRDKHVGWFYSFTHGGSSATLLGAQLIEILFIIGWTLAIMMPFFIWLDFMGWYVLFSFFALQPVISNLNRPPRIAGSVQILWRRLWASILVIMVVLSLATLTASRNILALSTGDGKKRNGVSAVRVSSHTPVTLRMTLILMRVIKTMKKILRRPFRGSFSMLRFYYHHL